MPTLRKIVFAAILSLALLIHAPCADAMVSSGTTAVVTSGDTAVNVFTTPSPTGQGYTQIAIINEGAVAGFFSIDNGVTWARLPAVSSVVLTINTSTPSLKVKRVAGGTDLAGIWGWAN